MGRGFPHEWDAFAAAVPAAERGGDLSAAYMTPVTEEAASLSNSSPT
jgi:hypothetical protein